MQADIDSDLRLWQPRLSPLVPLTSVYSFGRLSALLLCSGAIVTLGASFWRDGHAAYSVAPDREEGAASHAVAAGGKIAYSVSAAEMRLT